MTLKHLIVHVPFAKYQRGDVIKGVSEVEAVLKTHSQFVTAVAVAPAPVKAAKKTLKDKE